uniref:Uncharacterized protein n=1 Tax=Siphoviridae sp. ctqwO1 TaxID=2826472 RepID=A0A8S5QMN3_9CAUD|nr:MAG TPA: hypothetical protein [Siphoviridae sp. ctqwO1]
MAKWTDYPTKTTPVDTDDLMIYDATGKANKRVLFSGLWNWIVDKLTNAVISNLQTNNKTILGALNELNSNSFPFRSITSLTDERNAQFRFSVAEDITVGTKTIPAYTKGIIMAYTDAVMIGVFGADDASELYIGYRSQNTWMINCIK